MPASQGKPPETWSLQLQSQTEWICTGIKTQINQKGHESILLEPILSDNRAEAWLLEL